MPIKTDKRELVTLRDAGESIAGSPPRVQKMRQWEVAVAALLLVAEKGGRPR